MRPPRQNSSIFLSIKNPNLKSCSPVCSMGPIFHGCAACPTFSYFQYEESYEVEFFLFWKNCENFFSNILIFSIKTASKLFKICARNIRFFPHIGPIKPVPASSSNPHIGSRTSSKCLVVSFDFLFWRRHSQFLANPKLCLPLYL